MSTPTPDDRLAALDRDLERFEQQTRPPERLERPAPSRREPLSAGERRGRKILLTIILGWCALIFLLMALTNEGWTWVEWVFGPLFVLAVGFGLYGVNLFYWQLGKAIWKRGRSRSDARD